MAVPPAKGVIFLEMEDSIGAIQEVQLKYLKNRVLMDAKYLGQHSRIEFYYYFDGSDSNNGELFHLSCDDSGCTLTPHIDYQPNRPIYLTSRHSVRIRKHISLVTPEDLYAALSQIAMKRMLLE